ncbi:MAG: two-component system, NarL family, sensor histidine kinase DegS [Chloroflexota bacterium]|jgi:two-component system sensor histidine kinase DegS|nr:two-component system, NarL family, sensor histidine kinase DegS [Chloroflexota bacterium]
MNDDELDVVRARTTSRAAHETYTRNSMEPGTVAANRPVQADASPVPEAEPEMAANSIALEADPRVAMALLGAHEQERSRLAEELHDGPAQAFANAIFQTQLVERALREEPDTAVAELATLRSLLERELDTLRGYINQLRPSLGEAVGLDEALSDSASAISQRSGLLIELRLEADGAYLHAAARTVVLRVAQEALRNITKHAAASRAWIHTREEGTGEGRVWLLEVGDDGRGFDVEKVAAHPNRRHFGLRFMRERAELLGSSLAIESHHAAGTVVRLTIALGAERNQQ